MGYVTVTDICQAIPPSMIEKSAGTWTLVSSSGVTQEARTAADASFTLFIPVVLPGSLVGMQGAILKSVDVKYRINTAAADDFATVQFAQTTLGADASAPTGDNPAYTCDAAHDTAAERKAVAYHKMTVSLDTPVFIDSGDVWYLILTVDAAATTVFTLYGAQANYTLRF